jgi:hypothetical protein
VQRILTAASKLRISVIVFGLGVFCLIANHNLQAEEDPKPFDIKVQARVFGTDAVADIIAVLNSAALEIWKYCPKTRLGGIDVYYRADHPQTDFERNSRGRISIGLTARGTHWAQYSFQFAHEFCHTLANYGNNAQRSARHPLGANFWLEESLCETASLFTLRAMSRSWQTAPPYPTWREYAPWFNTYAEQRLALPEHNIGQPFIVWFQAHQPALRRNPAIRAWNTIVAIRLLPLFDAEPRGWESVTFLNRGPRDADESLTKHLAEWRSRCPTDLRPFVAKLAAIFAIKL